jgi:hypothetical protein
LHKIVFNVFASYKVVRLKCRGAAADSHAQSAALPRSASEQAKASRRRDLTNPTENVAKTGAFSG